MYQGVALKDFRLKATAEDISEQNFWYGDEVKYGTKTGSVLNRLLQNNATVS